MHPFFCIIKTEKYRELEIDKNNLRLVDKVMHYDRVVPGRLMKQSFQVMHLKQCSFFIKITNTILCKVEKSSHLINGWNICLRFGRAIMVAWPAALFCQLEPARQQVRPLETQPQALDFKLHCFYLSISKYRNPYDCDCLVQSNLVRVKLLA